MDLSHPADRRPPYLTAAIAIAAFVFATRWPFRSRALVSWDSANFALALDRIDIAAHRPHPPGYLGYVFVARALRYVLHDANTTLVAWNIIATLLAAVMLAVFAFEVADPGRRTLTSIAATAILLTSPLVWFYSEVAEIYSSELLFATLVGYTAWRASRGQERALYTCIAALALTAAFKLVTAILLFPLLVYAWTRVSSAARRRSATMVGVAVAIVIVLFAVIQPDLFGVASRFVRDSGWMAWYLDTDLDTFFQVINRNARNVLTATIAGVGIVNLAGLAIWMARDRRLPVTLSRGLALSWAIPMLIFFVLMAIAKPGYVLPLLPLAFIVVSAFYVRRSPGTAVGLIVVQAVVNVAHFILLTPTPASITGGEIRYINKPLWQRAASDLQPLTFPTRATIRASDARVHELQELVATSCADGPQVVFVDQAPVDWRRVMVYLPSAIAIHRNGVIGTWDFVGHNTDFVPIPDDGLDVATPCPVLWLAPDDGPGGVPRPGDRTTVVPRLGWTTPPGQIRVTPTSVSW